MRNDVLDLSYTTGSGPAPSTIAGAGKPFLPSPLLRPDVARVLDITAALGLVGAAVGKLLVAQTGGAALPTGNSYAGAGFWKQNATANAQIPEWCRGVVQAQLPAQLLNYQQADIVFRGPAKALVVAPANVAVAAGSLLIADANGNLTVPNSGGTAPSAGAATPKGTTGAATVTYVLYKRSAFGLDSAASANITTTTANATIDNTNSVQVAATIPAAVAGDQLVVVRTAGGASQGVIAIVPIPVGATSVLFVDAGYPAGSAYAAPTVPVFAPGQVIAQSFDALAAGTAATLLNVLMGSL